MLNNSRLRATRLFLVTLIIAMLAALPTSSWAAPTGQAEDPPEIGARAAIVVEYPSGRILYEKSMHDKLAPASTTKILTAILAIEHGNLDQVVTVSPDDLVGESSMGLAAGEQQTLHNLLYGMLLPSGNDAAMAVARTIGSEEAAPGEDPVDKFVGMMNARIAQLGLTDSHFVTPHGLDAKDHYSSAYDLASFTWYALHLPVFAEIVKQQFYEAPGHPLKNTNEMLSRYPGADGVKTGWTDAGGLCLVTSATRDGHRLISVVLNAPQWYTDSGAILDYGFAKLAAQPTDPSAEVLSVASRGAASFVLASATSTPALTTTTTLKQGGGVSSAPVALGSEAQQSAPASVVTHEEASLVNSALVASAVSSAPRLPAGSLVLMAVAFLALACGAGAWFVTKRRSLLSLAPAIPAAFADTGITMIPPEPAPAPAPRTLGAAPPVRRREPNLLLTSEELAQIHLERALALAEEGKQGSSMSEFLLAIRNGIDLNGQDLDAAYRLSPAGFLALARAQATAGKRDRAVETLEYAISVEPGDRFLHMALRQLRGN